MQSMAVSYVKHGLIAVIGSVLMAAAAPPAASSMDDDRVLAAFARRVEAYSELHRRLERTVPAPRVSADPAEIRRAVEGLADLIRAARMDARQGDIFTPDVAVRFRRLIAEGCRGDFQWLHAVIDDENPDAGRMQPLVNARHPGGAPIAMLAFSVLSRLPLLPEELEFRFMDRDLILWDWHADLIVDYLPEAIPTTWPTW